MMTTAISIGGMVCGACSERVRYQLADVPVVVHARVSVGTAIIVYDPSTATYSMLQGAIVRAGFVPDRLFRTGNTVHENA